MPVLYSYTAMIPSILPSTGPIGVFDSGYGGLTILDKIRGLMPEYDYIYLGDSARCPYGPRSFEVVYEFTLSSLPDTQDTPGLVASSGKVEKCKV